MGRMQYFFQHVISKIQAIELEYSKKSTEILNFESERQSILSSLNNQKESLKSEIETLNNKIINTKIELNQLVEIVEKNKDTLRQSSQLNIDLNLLKSEYLKLKEDISSSNQELSFLKSQINDSKKSKAQLDSLRKEYDLLKDKISEGEKINLKYNQTKKEYETISNKMTSLRSVQDQLESLKREETLLEEKIYEKKLILSNLSEQKTEKTTTKNYALSNSINSIDNKKVTKNDETNLINYQQSIQSPKTKSISTYKSSNITQIKIPSYTISQTNKNLDDSNVTSSVSSDILIKNKRDSTVIPKGLQKFLDQIRLGTLYNQRLFEIGWF